MFIRPGINIKYKILFQSSLNSSQDDVLYNTQAVLHPAHVLITSKFYADVTVYAAPHNNVKAYTESIDKSLNVLRFYL
jgi:hypothetical protein